MNRALYAITLCTGLAATGCVTPWVLTEKKPLGRGYRYGIGVVQPKNWYHKQLRRTTMFTRNGLALEYIMLESHRWHDTLTNGHAIPRDILLHEVPEIVLGEYCARGYAFNMNILSNEIVIIDSVPCSVTRYTLTAPNSLTKRGIVYCIPFRRFLTILTYEAEASHYFGRSIDEFNEVARSIVVRRRRYLPLPGIAGMEK